MSENPWGDTPESIRRALARDNAMLREFVTYAIGVFDSLAHEEGYQRARAALDVSRWGEGKTQGQ
jgi:hypothetical protein